MPLTVKDTRALAVLLVDYLEANGIGTLATDLFIQQLPESPQAGTVVACTGGPVDPADPTRRISFQIQHRNPSAEQGLRKVVQINNLLNDKWNVLTCFPGRIVAQGEAGLSFKDASGNFIFPLDYVIVSTTQR